MPRRSMVGRPIWRCARCGAEKPGTVHQNRQTYCSKECMSEAYVLRLRGEANPNFKDVAARHCPQCGVTFRVAPSSRKKYCSHKCYVAHDVWGRDGIGRLMRRANRTDANAKEILKAVRENCQVYDTSSFGRGFPDAIAWIHAISQWHFFEIKNPNTAYGKGGLSKSQKEWLNNRKGGGPVFVLYTVEDASKFSRGEFDGLKFEVGNTDEMNRL